LIISIYKKNRFRTYYTFLYYQGNLFLIVYFKKRNCAETRRFYYYNINTKLSEAKQNDEINISS